MSFALLVATTSHRSRYCNPQFFKTLIMSSQKKVIAAPGDSTRPSTSSTALDADDSTKIYPRTGKASSKISEIVLQTGLIDSRMTQLQSFRPLGLELPYKAQWEGLRDRMSQNKLVLLSKGDVNTLFDDTSSLFDFMADHITPLDVATEAREMEGHTPTSPENETLNLVSQLCDHLNILSHRFDEGGIITSGKNTRRKGPLRPNLVQSFYFC